MKLALLTAAVAAIGTGATVAATAGGQQPTKTIQVIEKRTAFKLIDNGRKGESAGDFGLLSGDLLGTDRKRLGRYQGVCVVLEPASGRTQCTFTLSFADGQVTTQAGYGKGFNRSKVVHEAIVGGTRSYSDARGEVLAEETGATTGKLTIQLAA